MSTTKNIPKLMAEGQARQLVVRQPTKKELLLELAEMFDRMPTKNLNSLPEFERWIGFLVRFVGTDRTVLEPVIKHLLAQGIDVKPNCGSVMKVLGLTHKQVHDAFCSCKHMYGIDGHVAAAAFRKFATTAR